MAELSLKSWNGFPLIVDRDFPLIVDSRSEAAPTPNGDRATHHQNVPATIIRSGDCREELPWQAPYDLIVAEACHRTGRRCIGCKIDPARAERDRARLASLLPIDSRRPA